MRHLSLGTFVVGTSVVVFFFGFNCLIPFLRAPADAGTNANQVLDRMSTVGAMAFPIGAALMGLGYFGIILSSRVRRSGYCQTCGYDLQGLAEPRCPGCDSGHTASAEGPPLQDRHTSDGDHALETEHQPAGRH